MYYLINALAGAVVAVAIAYVGRTSVFFLAGLIPLFPTFGLFAHVSAFQNGGVPQLKEVIIFGMISLFPYFAYLGALLFTIPHMRFAFAIALALVFWSAAALTIIYLWKTGVLDFKPPSDPGF